MGRVAEESKAMAGRGFAGAREKAMARRGFAGAREKAMARRGTNGRVPVAVALALITAACTAADEPASRATTAGSATADAYGTADMADHLARQLSILGDKMVQLAEAMPDDSYEWAPMVGVRSVGAVFAHVAADNYFVPALLDRPVEDTGITTTSGISDYEAARGSKAEIVADLRRSFDVMDEVLAETRGRMGEEVDLRGNAIATGDLWTRAIVHLHEHLGQSIAYARANGVVPPWSG